MFTISAKRVILTAFLQFTGLCICQDRVQEIDTHHCTSSDVHGKLLIVINEWGNRIWVYEWIHNIITLTKSSAARTFLFEHKQYFTLEEADLHTVNFTDLRAPGI